MRIRVLAALAILLTGALTPSADAHHSFAMFDRDRQVTLLGTVKEFQWTNPHCWVQLMVSDNGKQVEYSLEAQAINLMVRRGWRPGTLKPGEKVSVLVFPLRDGSAGGQLRTVTKADGTEFSTSY